jgi:hypothetical protein
VDNYHYHCVDNFRILPIAWLVPFKILWLESGPHCASLGTPFLQTMLVHFLVHEVHSGGSSNCDYWHGSFILMTMRRLFVPLPSVLWGDYTWKYINYRWRKKIQVYF